MENKFDYIEDAKFQEGKCITTAPIEYFEDRESLTTTHKESWHAENQEIFKFRVTMLLAQKYLNKSEMRIFKTFTLKAVATMWIKNTYDRERLRCSFLGIISNFWHDEFDRQTEETYLRTKLNENRALKQRTKFKKICEELKVLVDFFTGPNWRQADRKCKEVLDLSNRSYGLNRYKFLKRFIYHRGYMKRILVNYNRFTLQMAHSYLATILKILDDYPECLPVIELVNNLKKNKNINK